MLPFASSPPLRRQRAADSTTAPQAAAATAFRPLPAFLPRASRPRPDRDAPRRPRRPPCLALASLLALAAAPAAWPQQDAPPPAPSVAPKADGADPALQLSWPASSPPYELEATADLADPLSWEPVPEAPQANDGELTLEVSLPQGPQFFRLRPPPNAAPVWQTDPDQTAAVGQALTLDLSAADPDGDPVAFFARNFSLPENASLESQSGRFLFRPGPEQAGVQKIVFLASDGLAETPLELRIEVAAPDPEAPASLSGRLLDTNAFADDGSEVPIVGARVSLLGVEGPSTVSDGEGRFLLADVSAGAQVLDIDPANADPSPDGSPYAGFRESIELLPNVENRIERPLFLPRVAAESLTAVDPDAPTVVENPSLGVSLSIPAGSATRAGQLYEGQISISEVPDGLAPAAMPDSLQPGLLITIQPVGVVFATPAPISFPNADGLPPGAETDLWSLNPETGQFMVVGRGRVSDDGQRVETVAGGVRAADWHFILPLLGPLREPLQNFENWIVERCRAVFDGASSLFPFDGALSVRHDIPAYRSLGALRQTSLVYRSDYASPQALVSATGTIPTNSAVPEALSARLELGGIQIGPETWFSTEGLDENADESVRIALQAENLGSLESRLFRYRIELVSHFRFSSASREIEGELLVRNERSSPVGPGWTIGGLDRLRLQNDSEAAILERGDGVTQVYRKPQPGDFSPPEFFQTGFVTPGLAVGDWNSDGRLDLAAPGSLDSLFLFFGDGAGGFAPPAELPAGGRAQSIRAADLDGDGVPDLVMALGGADQIAVLLADGAGGFASPLLMDVPTSGLRANPVDAIAADLDGDGLPDLVSANKNEGNLTWWKGDGSGGFGSPAGIDLALVIGAPEALVAADFNRDGGIDLATANNTSLSLLLGNGSGAFAAPIQIDDVGASARLAAADLNHDGWPDFAATGDDQLFVLLNDAANGFLPAASVPLGDAASPRDLAVSDANLDGLPDLLVANFDGTVANLPGLGNGRFGAARRFDVDGASALALDVGDFDGNGAPDLAVLADNPAATNDQIAVLLNADPGSDFVPPPGAFAQLQSLPDGGFELATPDGVSQRFDEDGLLLARVDPNGNETAYEYDAEDRLFRIVDPAGLATTFTYQNGLLAEIRDPAGRVTRLERDAFGNLARIVSPDGSQRRFRYDARHRLLSKTLPRGERCEYEYDAAGRVTAMTLPDGSRPALSPAQTVGLPDPDSDLGPSPDNPAPIARPEDVKATLADGRGNAVELEFSRFGDVLSATDPLGNTTLVERNDDNLPVRRVDPLGLVSTFQYDALGNLTRRVDAAGTDLEQVRRFTRSESVPSRLLSATDPEGNVTSFEYDANGNLIRREDPLGGVRTFEYDDRGLLTHASDENGNATAFAYDDAGNLAEAVDPLGVPTRFERDAAGNATRVLQNAEAPEPRVFAFAYDEQNRLVAFVDPDDNAFSLAYDKSGNPIRIDLPNGQTIRRAYDARSRPVLHDGPFRGTLEFEYDAAGNLVRSVNAGGGETTLAYDALNRPVSVTNPAGGTVAYQYDVLGRLLALTDPLGNVTATEYDLLGRPVKRNAPDGSVQTLEYDKRNLVAAVVTFNGQRVEYQRDALGRVVGIDMPNDAIEYAYDPAGNLVSARDNDSRLTRAYDAANRLVEESTTDSPSQPEAVLTFSYDALGNRTALADSLGGQLDFDHDASGRLARLATASGAAVQLQRDSLGRQTDLDFGGGLALRRLWGDNGRVAQLDFDLPSPPVAQIEYQYDVLGNAVRVAEDAAATEYEYDSLQQLVAASGPHGGEAYAYDANGNRSSSHLSTAHVVNERNQILQDDAFAYQYDANGNLVAQTDAQGDVTEYVYDAFNRLVQVDLPDGDSVSFRYDALGRRIEKAAPDKTRRYVYDGADLFLEFDGENAPLARYAHGPLHDQPLLIERDGQTFRYLADRLGSVRFLAEADGGVANRYRYDSYGRPLQFDQTVESPYAFAGREYDPETGLYYNRARYYHPRLGRFISEDPIGFAGGDANLYRYVRNNPLNATDPLGLFSCEQFAEGATGVSIAAGVVATAAGAVVAAPIIAEGALVAGSSIGGFFASSGLGSVAASGSGAALTAAAGHSVAEYGLLATLTALTGGTAAVSLSHEFNNFQTRQEREAEFRQTQQLFELMDPANDPSLSIGPSTAPATPASTRSELPILSEIDLGTITSAPTVGMSVDG